MSKITKNERISTLEDAVAMNWSDMKKVETKISRAMTDMATRISNMSLQLEGQQRQIHLAAESIGLNKQAIIILENKAKPDPQLKQLDQSVFNGLDEKWRFAAVDSNSEASVFDGEPELRPMLFGLSDELDGAKDFLVLSERYDTSNWKNSLIERDIAKELLEVDLSRELTGSDLARAMFERGDNYIMCVVGTIREVVIIDTFQDGYFYSKGVRYLNPKPINNQGEPLMQSEAGL